MECEDVGDEKSLYILQTNLKRIYEQKRNAILEYNEYEIKSKEDQKLCLKNFNRIETSKHRSSGKPKVDVKALSKNFLPNPSSGIRTKIVEENKDDDFEDMIDVDDMEDVDEFENKSEQTEIRAPVFHKFNNKFSPGPNIAHWRQLKSQKVCIAKQLVK